MESTSLYANLEMSCESFNNPIWASCIDCMNCASDGSKDTHCKNDTNHMPRSLWKFRVPKHIYWDGDQKDIRNDIGCIEEKLSLLKHRKSEVLTRKLCYDKASTKGAICNPRLMATTYPTLHDG